MPNVSKTEQSEVGGTFNIKRKNSYDGLELEISNEQTGD